MTTIITNPDVIVWIMHYIRPAHALSIEINTGIKFSGGSIMNFCRETCGTQKRTKRGVLKDYIAWLQLQDRNWKPSDTMLKALEKPKS